MPDKRYHREASVPDKRKRYRAPAIFYFIAGAASGSSI
ncbi:hypothetical protein LTSEHVI_0313 [Salmonella enterica subsp. enterica serovar Hvittingfoss str. A4-620]|nr:hypothetical protein LTSEHVI_0313 [Salmonella enterica subsp. enterica serovar Hvittingfoss str. A4-620]